LATELNVSTRGLYRHLAEEGSSLQKLKDEVRREVAIQQLMRTSKALKQVASAAGFRNQTSFSRAFRQWTGQSPGEFRLSVARRE
jgi:AraC-like DNA-binding protein